MNNNSKHPLSEYLREDRMPHIWCSGCGIGIAVTAFLNALKQSRYTQENTALVSGIGCSGRVAGYIKLDAFHTTHGRAIPFAEGLKAASPITKVIVFSGEGDLMSIGGNHFLHAGRKNMSITIICINNLNYAMTGGQVSPTTPLKSITATAPFGSFCQPFNLPFIAEAAGAVYVARWTVFHVRQLQKAILEAIYKKGMSFVEVISPCPTLFERRNQMGTALSRMNFYKENAIIKDGANTKDAVMELDKPFIVGKFVDNDTKLTYLEAMNEYYDNTFKCNANYHTYKGSKK